MPEASTIDRFTVGFYRPVRQSNLLILLDRLFFAGPI